MNCATVQSWKWRLRESEATKVTHQEMDRNGIQIACFCDSRVLPLAVVCAFNQGLCLPAVTGGAWSCLVCRFISGVPFSEKPHDFHNHKRETHPESGNFSRSIWVNLTKANVRKIVCVCVCVCVNFPFCYDLLTISFKSLLTNTHLILNY